jgi:hypothetical protein
VGLLVDSLPCECSAMEAVLVPAYYKDKRPTEKIQSVWKPLEDAEVVFPLSRAYQFPALSGGFFNRLLFRLTASPHFEVDVRRSWKHGVLVRRGFEFALLEMNQGTGRLSIEVCVWCCGVCMWVGVWVCTLLLLSLFVCLLMVCRNADLF